MVGVKHEFNGHRARGEWAIPPNPIDIGNKENRLGETDRCVPCPPQFCALDDDCRGRLRPRDWHYLVLSKNCTPEEAMAQARNYGAARWDSTPH